MLLISESYISSSHLLLESSISRSTQTSGSCVTRALTIASSNVSEHLTAIPTTPPPLFGRPDDLNNFHNHSIIEPIARTTSICRRNPLYRFFLTSSSPDDDPPRVDRNAPVQGIQIRIQGGPGNVAGRVGWRLTEPAMTDGCSGGRSGTCAAKTLAEDEEEEPR
ncbi:hypothetical protein EX30DRAFT_170096 [Ascodesmis nigricans]|uniref:Uncharacterized protein n=1 Tax=Ascodesmis nigricans TaxID=341454 RepID=A0A4S2MLV9_9PEZI|nr:hypothetical protein EX30DRAFT_170096 [Ascodesmis nigricans]